jgi:UDP-glucose:(heptosyl)LPS alpha-1,3-glucosyltransferase
VSRAGTRRFRIALVIERFEPGGGVENVAWAVAHGLAGAGDEVQVVARRSAAGARVPVRRVRVPNAWQPARMLAFSWAAARAAPRDAFDVVHSFSRTRHQDVYRAGGGCHADYLERSYGARGRQLRRLNPRHATLLALERRIFSDPTQIVQCNSTLVRDEIMRRYHVPPERMEVIVNGVDAERFHPRRRADEGADLRAELSSHEGPVWLFAGSGFRRKGLDVALHALVAAGSSDAELWVAGRDEPRPWRELALRLGVEPRVRFLGCHDRLESLYAAADALLLPTRYDSFANVCLEAAAAGIPVITTAANGASSLLSRGAIVVENPEDVASVAKALDRLSDPSIRAELGREGRRIAEAHSWEAHVGALRALYARRFG